MMDHGAERQVSPTLAGIRHDHVARYRWAAALLMHSSEVVDFACGCGYGTQVLADAGHRAIGFDASREAIDFARTYYGRGKFRVAADRCPLDVFDASVCFETIEHLADPAPLLHSLRAGRVLFASVPNEDVMPYSPAFAFHHRHYTRDDFALLLLGCGWRVLEWWGQDGPDSDVERDVVGRTLIAVAVS